MSKARYRYLPHTADVKFIAYGSNFNEALENAALALINTMLDIKKIGRENAAVKEVKISEKAGTKQDLVWFILQDIVSHVDSEKLNAFRFEVKDSSYGRENAKITGNLYYKDIDEDNSMLEVKGITAHDLKVSKGNGRYAITVLVDV